MMTSRIYQWAIYFNFAILNFLFIYYYFLKYISFHGDELRAKY